MPFIYITFMDGYIYNWQSSCDRGVAHEAQNIYYSALKIFSIMVIKDTLYYKTEIFSDIIYRHNTLSQLTKTGTTSLTPIFLLVNLLLVLFQT